MPEWITDLLLILIAVLVFAPLGAWLVIQGVLAIRSLSEGSKTSVKIKIMGGNSLDLSGPGAYLLLLFGLLCLIICVAIIFKLRELQHVRSSLSALNEKYIALNDSYRNLEQVQSSGQSNQAEIQRALSGISKQSAVLEAEFRTRVTTQITAQNRQLLELDRRVAALKEANVAAQHEISSTGGDLAARLSELEKAVRQDREQTTLISERISRVGDWVLQSQAEEIAATWTEQLDQNRKKRAIIGALAGSVSGSAIGSSRLPRGKEQGSSERTPIIKVRVEDGVLYLEGKVPSSEIKTEIEKSFEDLKPKKIENQLVVSP